MLVIPAIDIFMGKVARLYKGDFTHTTFYKKSTLEYAKSFDAIGCKWLHVVDLAASLSGIISVGEQLKAIQSATRLKIQFGGGIKSLENASNAFSYGAERIIIGSISISHKNEFEKIIDKYGSDKIVVAVDVKNEMVLIKGWTEKSSVSLWEHLDYCISKGLNNFLCTDISKDGTLTGPNTKLYNNIIKIYPQIKLIASGGIGSSDDLLKLSKTDIYGTVVGKAIYEHKITMRELKQFVS